jgi:putative hemolysin
VAVIRTANGDLIVRLAHKRREVAAAQALRYQVFYREMGAAADLRTKLWRRDVDRFDPACDHLLVIDRARRKMPPMISGQVVGTCRLMRRSVADRRGGFYSESEFDLTPLLAHPGECLELGRSCVDPDYRARAVIDHLWSGIAEYVQAHGIGLMFGCASLPGTRPDELAPVLYYLHQHHLAPPHCRPRALPGRHVEMRRLPPEKVDTGAAWAALPPLLKGYLWLGAAVGDGAVVDHQFNTTDVCVVLPTERVTARYFQRYFSRLEAREAA